MNVVLNTNKPFSPFYIPADAVSKSNAPLARVFNERFASDIESGRMVSSFESNFELYLPVIKEMGGNFSMHAVRIPGFVGSLNDSLLVYGFGDRFLADVSGMIEKLFTSQGRACKVFSDGVSLVVCLEGDTPKNMEGMIKDVLAQGTFKYDVDLWDIPETEDGMKVKAKIHEWASKNRVPIQVNGRDEKITLDIKTFERMVGGSRSKGIPDPKVGSFDVVAGEDYTPRQMKTKVIKLLDWVKWNGGGGYISFDDPRLTGTQVDELVSIRDVDMKRINMNNVLRDFSADMEIFNQAKELSPEEFSRRLASSHVSEDSRMFLTILNESIYLDFKYNVLNEAAFRAQIRGLFSAGADFYVMSGDLTNLSGINREYGRVVGDGFLDIYFEQWKAVAETYAPRGITVSIFRSGADEFGVLIRGTKDAMVVDDIIRDFDSRINENRIVIEQKYLTDEEIALLKNKGIRPRDGKVEIHFSDMYRNYGKARGGRFDIGSAHTIFGSRVTAGDKRRPIQLESRIKAHAKESKKAADGMSYSVVIEGNEEEVFPILSPAKRNFSNPAIEFSYWTDYLGAGAPKGSIGEKTASLGYGAVSSAIAFGGMEAVIDLGIMGIRAARGRELNWGEYGTNVWNATKSGVEFGVLETSFKFGRLEGLAMPATLGIITINQLANAPDQYKGLALTQGAAGLGSFMFSSALTEMSVSKLLGYSLRTPGPWWIKAGALGAGFMSSKVAGYELGELYMNNPTYRGLVNSAFIRGTGNALSLAARPTDIALGSYAATKALNYVGTNMGSSVIPVIGAASLGTYAVIGVAEARMLDPYMRFVAERAKLEWKNEAGKDSRLASIGLGVSDFLASPFMDAMTPIKYVDAVMDFDEKAEKEFMADIGGGLYQAAVENDTHIRGQRGSMIPNAAQFKPELRSRVRALINQIAEKYGVENLNGFLYMLSKKYNGTMIQGDFSPLTSINLADLKNFKVTDALINLLLTRGTVYGKSVSSWIVDHRKAKK